MYDKIKLSVPMNHSLIGVEKYLDRVVMEDHKETESVIYKGWIDKLRVEVYPSVMYVRGSLSGYYYPNNLYPLDTNTTKEAIAKLSDTLHYQMAESKVISMEFGTFFVMNHKVTEYYEHLGDMPRMIRTPFADSLYYMQRGEDKKNTFVFYDKLADAKAKGMTLPDEIFKNKNLLKYEMRLNRRVAMQLKENEVIASTLSDYSFYRKCLAMYRDRYISIEKDMKHTDSLSDITSPREAKDVMLALLMQEVGQQRITEFMEDLKRDSQLNKKGIYRFKQMLKDVESSVSTDIKNELIQELDTDINDLYMADF